jgi:hypothetical protein
MNNNAVGMLLSNPRKLEEVEISSFHKSQAWVSRQFDVADENWMKTWHLALLNVPEKREADSLRLKKRLIGQDGISRIAQRRNRRRSDERAKMASQ